MQLSRPTVTVGPGGGDDKSTALIGIVQGNLQPMTGDLVAREYGQKLVDMELLITTATVEILPGDIMTHPAGVDYIVKAVRTWSGHSEIHLERG